MAGRAQACKNTPRSDTLELKACFAKLSLSHHSLRALNLRKDIKAKRSPNKHFPARYSNNLMMTFVLSSTWLEMIYGLEAKHPKTLHRMTNNKVAVIIPLLHVILTVLENSQRVGIFSPTLHTLDSHQRFGRM